MAAALRRCFRPQYSRIFVSCRPLHNNAARTKAFPLAVACGCVAGGTLAWYMASRSQNPPLNAPVLAKEHEESGMKVAVQTQRELRFLSFASVEYENNVYMTPQDFLESVMEETPRPRTGRTRLRKEEVDKLLKNTPQRWKGSTHLFRNLHDKGLISYTEYLFLLCVLTKPRSGFRIAFNMFDTDGNQRVDKKEFLVVAGALCALLMERREHKTKISRDDHSDQARARLERIITQAQKYSDETALMPDTTLLLHFFGSRGNEVLKYEDFHRFMDNLQTEMMELEFEEFGRGMATITEEEFAQILLRYTILSKDEQSEYIERLRKRTPHVKGILFDDFKEFGQFLNCLDDFAIAMRMYTFADMPISEDEFKRAVKVCTGQRLNDHLVHTVFQLFDIDGDGHLSHKEFISVMKDRLHRGFKSQIPHAGRWDMFKYCVKNEMKTV